MKTREGRIKALARAEGFDAAGITGAEPFAAIGEALRERVADPALRDYGIRLDTIPDRITPERALPGARSILSVALSYSFAESDIAPDGLRGNVARFARGADYHRVLEEKLNRLAAKIEDEICAQIGRVPCADTGSILDRPAALRAGIGWQGRNNCVFVRDLGSWVVLGELLMDIELEPDSPGGGHHCGGCDRCRQACPTGALAAPFRLEPSRCISHLTQSTGSIPDPLRPLIGARIYGCDLCQEVCPHNQRARPGNHPEMDPALGLGAAPNLAELLVISPREFEHRIGHTVLGRIGRRRLRRNAAIALGNLADPAAAPFLQKAAHGPDALIREHAKWALTRLG